MYRFLGYKKQNIDTKEYLNVSILYCDDYNCNYSVLRMYVFSNDENRSKLDYFNEFDDIDDYIAFKVRRDGKINITLK